MKFTKMFLVLFCVSACQLMATDIHGGKDVNEKRYITDSKILPDQSIQKSFRQNVIWQDFQQKYGNWFVSFDERTGMPHRASGKPVFTGGVNPVEAAQNFLRNSVSGYGVPMEDLKFQTENFSGKYYNVFYTQKYSGLDILNSQVFIKLTPDMKVSTFGLDVFKIAGLSVQAAISTQQINSFAQGSLNVPVISTSKPVLKILPLPLAGRYDFRLVYEMIVSTMDENDVPGEYYSLLDANSGELLYRQNKVRFSNPASSDVSVTGTVSLYSPFQPTATVPLRNLKVDNGTTLVYTDSLGEVNLAGASPVSGLFYLAGKWSKVYTNGGNVSPSVSATFNGGTGALSFDSLTTLSHVSGYYHVNIVHDFMKSYFPLFTSLDISLTTQIDLSSGSCNAFYNGSSINFYSTGSGCNSMALVGDIVYHEYGHGINDKFYQWQGGSFNNGGMGEGYADVWGLSIKNNPILGSGYRTSSSTSYIRRYDIQKKVYPQNLTGEVHDDGEIIAGAWYDVSLNLGSWSAMTSLFASTYYDLVTGPDGTEGQVYTDILLSALNNDDNDGDLSNGTPNDLAIINAFDLHGISLLNNVDIIHTEVISSARLTPITVEASMAAQYPWYAIVVRLNYRTSPSDPWTQIAMSNNGTGTYSALIPGQVAGTVIEYFIESLDGAGTTLSTNPDKSIGTDINIPYFILVDFEQRRIEDFDANFSAAWLTSLPTDNALSGFWVIDSPVPSYTTANILCQTGSQHTVGGIQCAVTGNAISSTSSVGYNDVDGGKTTLQSPLMDITAYSIPVLSYWRWYTNDLGSAPNADYWRTYISADGINFLQVENVKVSDREWRRYALKVHDYFPGATSVMMRFVADDASGASIVEGAVDDVELLDVAGSVSVAEVQAAILNLRVYPNPAGSQVKVEWNSSSSINGTVEMLNALGQVMYLEKTVWNSGMNQLTIETDKFSNGVYRIVLKSDKSVSVIPLSVLHK